MENKWKRWKECDQCICIDCKFKDTLCETSKAFTVEFYHGYHGLIWEGPICDLCSSQEDPMCGKYCKEKEKYGE